MCAILILITDKHLSPSCWMWNFYGTCSINFIQTMHKGLIKCTLLLFSCYTLFFCILTNASLYKLYGNHLVMRERKVKRERERRWERVILLTHHISRSLLVMSLPIFLWNWKARFLELDYLDLLQAFTKQIEVAQSPRVDTGL